jgi:hypothetical protein
MNDQRQSGFPGRSDMSTETSLLHVPRAVVVEVIKAGFADTNYFGMICALNQVFGRHTRLFFGLMRMDTNRTPNIPVCLCDFQNIVELCDPGADRDHRADARIFSALYGFGTVFIKDVEIKVAVTVNKHRRV